MTEAHAVKRFWHYPLKKLSVVPLKRTFLLRIQLDEALFIASCKNVVFLLAPHDI